MLTLPFFGPETRQVWKSDGIYNRHVLLVLVEAMVVLVHASLKCKGHCEVLQSVSAPAFENISQALPPHVRICVRCRARYLLEH